MGAVYKNADERLNSICAVKKLLTDYEDETEQSKEWFLREARILAQLNRIQIFQRFLIIFHIKIAIILL